MNTLLLRVAVIAAALMLVCTDEAHAQFDTELIKATEYADCGDSVSLYGQLSSPTIPITRTVDRFRLGLNWYGLDSLTRMFGMSIMDDYVYDSNPATNSILTAVA